MLGYLRSGNKRTKMIWWIVTIATVFTFVIGFSFFGGLGRDPNWAARQSGAYGSVNGEKITREMWQTALDTETQRYKQRFGTDPVDRDLMAVTQQAWRDLVNERLLVQAGVKAGLTVTDNDVLAAMQIDPPGVLLVAPAFQTNGKFDPTKYSAALHNPNNDWSIFETEIRSEGPGKKLQEILGGSVKFSNAELREAFDERYTRMVAMVVQVPPADSGRSPGGDAEMQRVYDKYKYLLATPARTQLEVLQIPIKYSAEEIKTAESVANGIYQRIQKGENFDQLCHDYSEGLNADHGGVIDRFLNPAEMGPAGSQIAAHKPGDVIPPMRDGGTIMIFRILDPARDTLARNAPAGQVKLAQITVKVRPNSDGLHEQYAYAQAIAKRAKDVGLSRAATEKGLSTAKTGFFDLQNMPQQLYSAPDAADWGLTHKKGEVSPVFQGPDLFLVAQVSVQQAAGVPAKEDVSEELKQIADFDVRVEASKKRSDQVTAALKSGASLEDAAKAAGLQAQPVMITLAQPDPRLARAPELLGALWSAKPGQVVGPIHSAVGYFFGRVQGIQAPPDSLWANVQMRNQLTTDIINRRQSATINGYVTLLRRDAKIEDSRNAYTSSTQ